MGVHEPIKILHITGPNHSQQFRVIPADCFCFFRWRAVGQPAARSLGQRLLALDGAGLDRRLQGQPHLLHGHPQPQAHAEHVPGTGRQDRSSNDGRKEHEILANVLGRYNHVLGVIGSSGFAG